MLVVITEVHISDKGNLHKCGTGYNLYRSGRPKPENHFTALSFIARDSFLSKPYNLPKATVTVSSPCVLHPTRNMHYSFVCKSKTFQEDQEEIRRFCAELSKLQGNVIATDKVVIFCDFKARVDWDFGTWKFKSKTLHKKIATTTGA